MAAPLVILGPFGKIVSSGRKEISGENEKKDRAVSVCQKEGYKPPSPLVKLSCPTEHGEAQYNCKASAACKYFPLSADGQVCEQCGPGKELAAF